MQPEEQLRTAVVGTVVIALCCFTPVLAMLVAALVLAALTSWIDVVLIPALAFVGAITAYAFWKLRRTRHST